MTMMMMRQLVANVEKKVEEVEVMMMMDGTVMMNICASLRRIWGV